MRRVILGISAFNHDAAAALIIDGQLRGFLEEERVTEQKGTGAVPHGSIKALLQANNLEAADITDIAFYFSPTRLLKSYIRNNNPVSLINRPLNFFSGRPLYELSWLTNFALKVQRLPATIGADRAVLHCYAHHDCHVWYGIFAANLPRGIVLSNDSVGEDTSSIAVRWSVSRSGEVTTDRVFSQTSPHSIGYLYGAVTERLGFSRQTGAGKVMALASYCQRCDATYFEERLDLRSDGRFRFRPGLVVDRSYKPAAQRLHRDLLARYPIADVLDETHYDLAFGVQRATEHVLAHQVRVCASLASTIVVTGGVAQNSVANGLLAASFPDHELIVPPVPHDSGCAIGAALLCAYGHHKRLPEFVDTAFLGSAYDDEEVHAHLGSRGIGFRKYNKPGECLDAIAATLFDGKAVGLFRGPMECGPRALGNRSIIALPSVKNIADDLNRRVKYREPFRPYGVIVCETQLHRYFAAPRNLAAVPHMTHVFPVLDEYIELLEGVVHIDRTCRVQTAKPTDRFLHALFDRLEAHRLPRMTINTSMNVRGKPISRSIDHALACFYTSGLDAIVFNEKFLVTK